MVSLYLVIVKAVSGVQDWILGLPEVFHVRSFFLLLEALVWLLLCLGREGTPA